MLKIWGHERSSNVQKVRWLCDELGLEYEPIDIGGTFGGNKDPAYLKLNPNGQIPTLEDGDFVLWESNSILRYIVEKYGNGRLVPETVEGRAIANCWMDWQLAALGGPSGEVMRATVRTPREDWDPARIEKGAAALGAMWQRFEDGFGDGDYVAGDFSIGDIPPGVLVQRWFAFEIERPELPKVRAWYQRLCSRPPYRTHVTTKLMPGQQDN